MIFNHYLVEGLKVSASKAACSHASYPDCRSWESNSHFVAALCLECMALIRNGALLRDVLGEG
jgi:hypothetical protein